MKTLCALVVASLLLLPASVAAQEKSTVYDLEKIATFVEAQAAASGFRFVWDVSVSAYSFVDSTTWTYYVFSWSRERRELQIWTRKTGAPLDDWVRIVDQDLDGEIDYGRRGYVRTWLSTEEQMLFLSEKYRPWANWSVTTDKHKPLWQK